MAVLCIASMWWLAAAVARADTPPASDGTLPTISGTPQQGQALSATPGGWTGDAPLDFAYVWSDGQTGPTVTLSAADIGQALTVTVTASNAFGQSSATSAATAPVQSAAPTPGGDPPLIDGIAQQGLPLSVSNGSWGNDPTSYAYAWEDCDGSGNNCVPITGAASSSYTPQASDVGHAIVATVTASNAFGDGMATSTATAAVLPAAPTPGSDPPTITGTVQQGHTLSVSDGAWNNIPTGLTYVWEDCDGSGNNCVPITGATSSRYTLQASDVGRTVVAEVIASNKGGTGTATSTATTAVLPAPPQLTTAPGIGGATQQGKTLTVGTGAWANTPTSFSYAWQDCGTTGSPCSPIPGATSSSYNVPATYVTHYLTVQVTATNAGGSTPVYAAGVGPVVPPAPANTALPAISPKAGTLSVSDGTWNYASSFTYLWESCDSTGANCTAIPGATSSSYALSAADLGSTIVCVVTASGLGGSTSVTTARTGVVRTQQVPPASQATTTELLATPSVAVTNQSVTLIATVTAGTSSTALWGTVTFERGGAAIPGCAHLPAVPSGGSATVACSASFAASTVQLSAVFTPAAGSILKGSVSAGSGFTVGRDSTATTLTAASAVDIGTAITYTATVATPASRPGPVRPAGSVEFLDGSTPIGSCSGQPITNGTASCTVSYAAEGTHQIAARYSGDANFSGSISAAEQVSAVPAPTPVLGTITATMQWAFYFTQKYTVVRNLVVNGAPPGARVLVRCHGRGCPFASHAALLTKGRRCGRKARRSCVAPGRLDLTSSFGQRRLRVGTRITISIIRSNWVGKSYRFTVRPRRGPRVQIASLPVG